MDSKKLVNDIQQWLHLKSKTSFDISAIDKSIFTNYILLKNTKIEKPNCAKRQNGQKPTADTWYRLGSC